MPNSTTGATDSEADSGNPAQRGVEGYRQALVSAGGRELEALMHGGDRAAVCVAIYASPPYDLRVPPLPLPRLSVNLTRALVSGGIDGERFRSFNARRYSLFLTPAGASANWRKDSPSRHLNIYFHPDAFDGGDDDAPSLAEAPVFNACVPGMGLLFDQLVDELEVPTLMNEEAADSLGRLVLVRLARHRWHATTASSGLTTKVLMRLRDYVVEHLSERILVADLAKQAGLSPNRFALSYSERTGHSPHQFVLALRLEHAAAMLRLTTLSLTEVAHACGFASQQHLSNAIRRRLGTTPGLYRALHRSTRALPLSGVDACLDELDDQRS